MIRRLLARWLRPGTWLYRALARAGFVCTCYRCDRLTASFIRYGTWRRGISLAVCPHCSTSCRTEFAH